MNEYLKKDNIHFLICKNYIISIEILESKPFKTIIDKYSPIYDDITDSNKNLNKRLESDQKIILELESPFSSTIFPKKLFIYFILNLISKSKIYMKIISFIEEIDFCSFFNDFKFLISKMEFCNDFEIDGSRILCNGVVVCDTNVF